MQEAGYWLLIGVLTGLAHLTRADGILILPVVALAPLIHVKGEGGAPDMLLYTDLPLLLDFLLWGVSVVLIMYLFTP